MLPISCFNESMKKNLCPVCGKYEFKEPFDICPSCGWEKDSYMEGHPNEKGGANPFPLNTYRLIYKSKIKENPNYQWDDQ